MICTLCMSAVVEVKTVFADQEIGLETCLWAFSISLRRHRVCESFQKVSNSKRDVIA